MLTLKKIVKIYIRGILISFIGLHLDMYNRSLSAEYIKFNDYSGGILLTSVTWPISYPFIGIFQKDSKYIFGIWLALILIP